MTKCKIILISTGNHYFESHEEFTPEQAKAIQASGITIVQTETVDSKHTVEDIKKADAKKIDLQKQAREGVPA